MRVRKPKGKSSTKKPVEKRINKRKGPQERNEDSIPNIDRKGARKRNKKEQRRFEVNSRGASNWTTDPTANQNVSTPEINEESTPYTDAKRTRKRNEKGQSTSKETPWGALDWNIDPTANRKSSTSKQVAQTSDLSERTRKRNKKASEGKPISHARNGEDNKKKCGSVGTIREGGIKKKTRSKKDISSRIEDLRSGGLLDEVEVLRDDDDGYAVSYRRRSRNSARSCRTTNPDGSPIRDDQLELVRDKVYSSYDPHYKRRLAGMLSNSDTFLRYNQIDLHGLDVSHAKMCIRLCSHKPEMWPDWLYIIVGKGNHSANGPVLRPTIMQFLTDLGIHNQIDPNNSGRLQVYIREGISESATYNTGQSVTYNAGESVSYNAGESEYETSEEGGWEEDTSEEGGWEEDTSEEGGWAEDTSEESGWAEDVWW